MARRLQILELCVVVLFRAVRQTPFSTRQAKPPKKEERLSSFFLKTGLRLCRLLTLPLPHPMIDVVLQPTCWHACCNSPASESADVGRLGNDAAGQCPPAVLGKKMGLYSNMRKKKRGPG